ncbi:MAG: hybrid sensor histidine kinase/response regulator, partial [Gemmataceae bacterium]|nr:hybrid sensor histidine kinase/response regulator [Gemmataceae bacterium]
MAIQKKHCLLVVDDEPDLVQSVKDLLRFDYKVLTATRATEALKIVQNEKIHIVMTDQRMPEMTGVEFLKHLKESHPEAVRLLFTAYADLNAVTDAINQGNVYRYISKPWESEELKSILRQAVDYYDLQEERRQLIREVQEKNLQLEKANVDLRQANELKKAFIRVASHELRTPLTIVMGLSELAHGSPAAQEPFRDWMGQMHKASVRLNERVNQVVKMLQAEKYERTLQPRTTDVAGLLRAAAAEVDSFVKQRGHEFQVEAAAEVGSVWAEPDKIHDSLVQLLVNAIKFTPDGGRIRLSARRSDGQVEIAVTDNGTGIDAASLSRIFEPFFTRFDVSRHSSGDFEFDRRGLGLGLAMVKLFVEMHGGKVAAQS